MAYLIVIHVTTASPRLRTPTREANTRLCLRLNVRPAPPVTPLNRELGLATVNTHQSAIATNQPVDNNWEAEGIQHSPVYKSAPASKPSRGEARHQPSVCRNHCRKSSSTVLRAASGFSALKSEY
jgi:hypothetical protein